MVDRCYYYTDIGKRNGINRCILNSDIDTVWTHAVAQAR